MRHFFLFLVCLSIVPLSPVQAGKAEFRAWYKTKNPSAFQGDTSALEKEIAALKDQLARANVTVIPQLQKKIQDLEARLKAGGAGGNGANNAGGTGAGNGNAAQTPQTPPVNTNANVPPPPSGNIPVPPPPPPGMGSTLPSGVTQEMENIRKAFFSTYKLVAKKIKDGKYPPGLWKSVNDIITHPKIQSKVAADVKRAQDNYAVSKALLDEFSQAYLAKKSGFNQNKNSLYTWFVYITNFTLRAGKYKKITWPVAENGTLTQAQYWTLMKTLRGNINLMGQDLKAVLKQEVEAAQKAAAAQKAKATKGKFQFTFGDGRSVQKDIGRLFTEPLFRKKIIAHYGPLLITKKTTNPNSQKAAEGLFSWIFERLLVPFLPSNVSPVALQGTLRLGIIKAVQKQGIHDQGALEAYLKDQAKSATLMNAIDEALKEIIVAKGIPALRKGAPALTIPKIGDLKPEHEQTLLFAIQGKLNTAVDRPLKQLLKVLKKAPLPGGTSALEGELMKVLQAGLKQVFAGKASIVLQVKGEVAGYDFWNWKQSFENPNAKVIKTSKEKINALLASYQKDLAAFHAGSKTLPPSIQMMDALNYGELKIKIDEKFLSHYAKLILQRVAEIMKGNKKEYKNIKESNAADRGLILSGVSDIKSPLNKFLVIKNAAIAGSGDMKQEVQPYVDRLIAAYLLQQ